MGRLNQRIFLWGLALAILSGCSDSGPERAETVPVTGVLTIGGKAIEGATVTFHHKEQRESTGTTDKDGKFTLTTYDTGDGAIPGHHQITITFTPQTETSDLDALAKEQAKAKLIPQKYNSTETSGLEKEVKEGEDNHFPLEL